MAVSSKPEASFDVLDRLFGMLRHDRVAETAQILRGSERFLTAPLKPPAVPHWEVPHRHFQSDAFAIRLFAGQTLLVNDYCISLQGGVCVDSEDPRKSPLYLFVLADRSRICVKCKIDQLLPSDRYCFSCASHLVITSNNSKETFPLQAHYYEKIWITVSNSASAYRLCTTRGGSIDDRVG
jgi:hypothetical protein